jgi:hypothetical protein
MGSSFCVKGVNLRIVFFLIGKLITLSIFFYLIKCSSLSTIYEDSFKIKTNVLIKVNRTLSILYSMHNQKKSNHDRFAKNSFWPNLFVFGPTWKWNRFGQKVCNPNKYPCKRNKHSFISFLWNIGFLNSTAQQFSKPICSQILISTLLCLRIYDWSNHDF